MEMDESNQWLDDKERSLDVSYYDAPTGKWEDDLPKIVEKDNKAFDVGAYTFLGDWWDLDTLLQGW